MRHEHGVFRNGSLFDGHRYVGARAPWSCGTAGSPRSSRPAPRSRRATAGGDRGRRPRRRAAGAPASSTPTCTPSRAGWSGSAATCPELETREDYLADDRGLRRRAPRRCPGSSAAAGRCRPSPEVRRPPPTSTPSCRTGRCSCPTATTTAPGSTPGPSSSPASTRSTPDPPHGRFERDADGRPTGTLHEGAMARGGAARARDQRGRVRRRRSSPVRPTCTRSGSPAGRTRSSAPTPGWTTPGPTTVRAAARGDLTGVRRGRAVVGPRPRRGAGRRPGRAARGRTPTAGSAPRASRSCRTASPRTAPPR